MLLTIGFLDDRNEHEAKSIGGKIMRKWNGKIDLQFDLNNFTVQVIDHELIVTNKVECSYMKINRDDYTSIVLT